jgi:hypothetical protein
MCSALCAGATAASAQTDNQLAIGANFTSRATSASTLTDSRGPGLAWRIGHDKTGWGWHWGLNWYSTDVNRPVGGGEVDLGELRVRPFMSGYGYTRVIGPVSVTADVLGGYAINTLTMTPAARDAFRDRLGAHSLSGDARNTLVAKPEIGFWYDVNRKVGINVNVGYLIARPRVIVRSTLGTDDRRVRADALSITVGTVYSIRRSPRP